VCVPIKSDLFYHFFLWVAESLSQLLHLIRSQLPSKLPASPPIIEDLESQSSQPQPSSSNTTSESQSPQARPPPSPQSPPVGRLLLTINESQRNNILNAKPDLETELRKTLLNLCFTAAIQITIQYGQVAESETHINNKKIHFKKIQRDNIKKKYTRLWVFGGLKIF